MGQNTNKALKYIMMIAGIIIYAISIKWFYQSSGLITKGFMGLALLISNALTTFYNINVSITLINLLLNLIPFAMVFFIIGKKFAVISMINSFAVSLIVDILPPLVISKDLVMVAVFGGITEAIGLGLMLKSGSSSGGTDYIAMLISHKFNKSAFNYILIFNALLIFTQGVMFNFNLALYSLVGAFVSTQGVNMIYKNYDKSTLLIITEKPNEIAEVLTKLTKHSATKFTGTGCYTNKEKYLLYTVLSDPEVKYFLQIVNDIDKSAFVNVMKSNAIYGNFNYLPIGK